MAECSKDKEEICVCKDCGVDNCYRFNCMECESKKEKDINEMLRCNNYREIGG